MNSTRSALALFITACLGVSAGLAAPVVAQTEEASSCLPPASCGLYCESPGDPVVVRLQFADPDAAFSFFVWWTGSDESLPEGAQYWEERYTTMQWQYGETNPVHTASYGDVDAYMCWDGSFGGWPC